MLDSIDCYPKESTSAPTECEPVGGCVQGLGHGDAQQVVEEAGDRAPGRVRVAAQAVQEHVPAHNISLYCSGEYFC